VTFTRALLLLTLSVGTRAVFSFLVAAATRHISLPVFLLVLPSCLDEAWILWDSRIGQWLHHPSIYMSASSWGAICVYMWWLSFEPVSGDVPSSCLLFICPVNQRSGCALTMWFPSFTGQPCLVWPWDMRSSVPLIERVRPSSMLSSIPLNTVSISSICITSCSRSKKLISVISSSRSVWLEFLGFGDCGHETDAFPCLSNIASN